MVPSRRFREPLDWLSVGLHPKANKHYTTSWWHLGLKLRVCVLLLTSCIKRLSPLPLQEKKNPKSGRQIWGQFNSDVSSAHFQKFKKCYPRAQSEEITFGFLRRCWLAKVKANHCFNSACRCCLCQIKPWISSSGGSDGLKRSDRAGVSHLFARRNVSKQHLTSIRRIQTLH